MAPSHSWLGTGKHETFPRTRCGLSWALSVWAIWRGEEPREEAGGMPLHARLREDAQRTAQDQEHSWGANGEPLKSP